ncbi:hypothetical protein BX264_4712 [Streptomyces sp. 2333.5]|uniref:hypothetical protein n=1 Tax=unclassified Streptomyces TaxID=2593676 RepID=UPI00089D56F1|nr:hypothetical protein BX264_4712 [Streptomyces sp. 2333.5]SEE47055.1 hypothetical protein SAMN05428943_4823 [Streptomyces sp. 2314.4]SEE73977.1 hypothetical protein SAMN05428942_4813 [Streptomyces sp. 2112.2]
MSAIPPGAGPRSPSGTRRTGRAALVAAVCAALAAALTGCGGEDPDAGTNGLGKLPPTKIESKARAAARRAGTVHLSGNVVSQGRTYKLDMSLAKDGAKGALTTKAAAFQLLRVGDALYLKADASFWAGEKGGASGGAASKLDGKYVKVPAADPVYKRFSGFTDKDTLLAGLLGLHGKLTAGDRSDVDGVRTIRLAASGGAGGTLDVSLDGTPYPLRLQRAGGAGVLRLDDWGKRVDLKAPAGGQVVDYGSKIGKG